jgi:hypothetical protein
VWNQFAIYLSNIFFLYPSSRTYAEEASLSITKEVQETSAMFATSTFVGEDAKSLNLVEGEKIYVIGKSTQTDAFSYLVNNSNEH